MRKIFCAVVLVLALFGAAWGQDIVVSGDIGFSVYGNGTPPDGDNSDPLWPFDYASGNSVTVKSGGKVTGEVFGGYAYSDDMVAATAAAEDNIVTVEIGGDVTVDITGGHAYGDGTADAEAMNNKVKITGGKVQGGMGGNAYSTGSSGNAIASGNEVTITGGLFDADIRGGVAHSTDGNATATDNIMTISGSPEFDPTSLWLTGGNAWSGGGTATSSGNKLALKTKIEVQAVEHFQLMDFYLPAGLKSGDAMLTVAAAWPVDLVSVDIKITGMGAQVGENLSVGESVILISKITGKPASPDISGPVEMPGGTWTFSTDGGVLTATLEEYSELYAAKIALAELIGEAEAEVAKAEAEGKNAAAIALMKTEIAKAKTALESETATVLSVKTATEDLQTALNAFRKAIKSDGGGCNAGLIYGLALLALPFVLKRKG
ncbi:MAG: hypothetical protein FWG09_04745 [Synergistaceae bacterium]|nr:hypothetical protein [Synergistaceae bacterium]